MSTLSDPMIAGVPPRRNWLGRNWKWLVPRIILVPLLLAAFVVGVMALALGMMKSSEPYQHAVAVATHDQRAVEALGEPVQPGWLVSGFVNVTLASGDANLAIPLKGKFHEGTLYVVAKKSAGQWSYERLELEVEGQPKRIDLLNDSSGTSGRLWKPSVPPAPHRRRALASPRRLCSAASFG